LQKDSIGLRVELDLAEGVTYANDLQVTERGDARGGSFAFRTIDDSFSLVDGTVIREVIDMTVRENLPRRRPPSLPANAVARCDG
jgi:phage head maturation protease